MLLMFGGEMELLTEILRAQKVLGTDTIDGFGCRFLSITQSQEERLARFIFDCQLAEREKQKQKRDKEELWQE